MAKARVVTVTVSPEKQIAIQLEELYNEAVATAHKAVETALKFGAALIEAEQIVFADGNPKWGNGHESGYGIKGWLEKNCPTVNYKTAIRWKSMAEKACLSLGCDRRNGVALLLGKRPPDEARLPTEEMKERVDELYAAPSMRKLTQMCFDFASEDKVEKELKPLPKLTKQQEAETIWAGIIATLGKNSVRDSIPLLGQKATVVCVDKFTQLLKDLKKHQGEF